MMWNEKTQQDARIFVESVTEKQWNALLYAFDVLKRQPTPEEQAQERERQAKLQQEREARYAEFEERKSAFQAMEKKINNNLAIPGRYEWSYDELHPLFNYAIHPLAGTEGILNLANAMYNLGFKRGMSYQQSKVDKKIEALSKKARHPSRIKAATEAAEALAKALS